MRRPGKFRWEYTPAGAGPQLLVADGTNLWFYDRDLQQATVKPAAAALTTTPVILLSGTASEMRAAFTITDEGTRDGLAWVQVMPRSAAAEFSSAELGFRGDAVAAPDHPRSPQPDGHLELYPQRARRAGRGLGIAFHATGRCGCDRHSANGRAAP